MIRSLHFPRGKWGVFGANDKPRSRARLHFLRAVRHVECGLLVRVVKKHQTLIAVSSGVGFCPVWPVGLRCPSVASS
jgi:hypothetical protein